MRISVAVHGHLQDTSAIGKEEVTFTLPDASGFRIRDLLESLNILEEEIRRIIINGRIGRLDEALRHRIKVELFPRQRNRQR